MRGFPYFEEIFQPPPVYWGLFPLSFLFWECFPRCFGGGFPIPFSITEISPLFWGWFSVSSPLLGFPPFLGLFFCTRSCLGNVFSLFRGFFLFLFPCWGCLLLIREGPWNLGFPQNLGSPEIWDSPELRWPQNLGFPGIWDPTELRFTQNLGFPGPSRSDPCPELRLHQNLGFPGI